MVRWGGSLFSQVRKTRSKGIDTGLDYFLEGQEAHTKASQCTCFLPA